MAIERPAPPGKKKALFAGIAVVGSLTVCLAGIEVGLRVVPPKTSYTRWHERSYTYLLDESTDWKLEPRRYTTGETVNADFFRGPRIPRAKASGVFRILLLGGSAAFDLFRADQESWPYRLEVLLSGPSTRPIQVLNAGTPGYSSWQSYRLLRDRMIDWQPDLVLVYHLYNDSLAFRFDDERAIIDGWRRNARANYLCAAAHSHRVWDGLAKLLPRVVDYARMVVVDRARRRVTAENHAFWLDPTLSGQVQPTGFGFFRKNLIRIAELLEPRGIPMVIVSQASVIRPSMEESRHRVVHYALRGLSPPLLAAAYERAWVMNRELARTHDHIHHIAAHERIAPHPRYFVDEVHLTRAGGELLARVVADGLRRQRLVP